MKHSLYVYTCLDKFRLELLTHIGMLLMLEKVVQGGISHVVKRYAKTKIKYLIEQYNSDDTSTYLLHINARDRYGWE